MKLPLSIKRYAESFIVTDVTGLSVFAVYFDNGNASERAIRHRMSEEEAEALVKRIARFLTDDTPQE